MNILKSKAIKFFRGDVYISTTIANINGINAIESAKPVSKKDDIILVKFGTSPYYMDLLNASLTENISDSKQLIKKPRYDYGKIMYKSASQVEASAEYFADNLYEIDPMLDGNFQLIRSFMNRVCPEFITSLDEEIQDKIKTENKLDEIIGL